MTRLSIGIAIAPFIFLAFFSTAHAQSSTQLQAELNALLQQLSTLQSQLQTTTGSASSIPTVTGVYGQCPNLGRALRQGMSGSDVTGLQAFLAADAQIYPEATISGYFGALTQLAIQRFQSRHAIASSGSPETTGFGSVGPSTRAVIGSLCKGTAPGGSVGGSCSSGGIAIAHGATAEFYSANVVPSGANCTSYKQTRQCVNGVLSGNTAYQYASCSAGGVNTPGSCTFNGATMANGESRTFFRQETIAFGQQCQGALRTCINGIVGGSSEYAYPTCAVPTGPISCTLNGVTVPHGQSLTFYKKAEVLFGQSCATFVGTRSCDNGSLSGDSDYRYASCTAAGAKSCTIVTTVGTTTSTTTVAHGASRNFWSQSSTPYTGTCEAFQLSRTCNDGVLTGSSAYKYPKCAVVPENTCAIDGITVGGGESHTFYTARSVAASASCASIDQVRTCTNGVLSGTATYKYAYCAQTGKRYCVLDGTYVAHGASRSFYSTESAAFGSSCAQFDQSRTCTDGTLDGSGSYQYASCTNTAGASCVLDGTTVSHNQTRTFYSRRTPSSGNSCGEYALPRICTDGFLSGDANFEYSSCSDSTSMISDSQVAAALAAMEALLKAALEKLNLWF